MRGQAVYPVSGAEARRRLIGGAHATRTRCRETKRQLEASSAFPSCSAPRTAPDSQGSGWDFVIAMAICGASVPAPPAPASSRPAGAAPPSWTVLVAGAAAIFEHSMSRTPLRRSRDVSPARWRPASGCPACRSRIAGRDARKARCKDAARRPCARPSTVRIGCPRLHREHQAGAHRPAVDHHRAGAADAVLAADMRAGQAASSRMARQDLARLDMDRVVAAVDVERDVDFVGHCDVVTSAARRRTWRAPNPRPPGSTAPRSGMCPGGRTACRRR